MSPGSALLLLDLQRDFLEDSGRMPVARDQVAPVLAASNALVDAASASGTPIVYVLNAFPRSAFVLNLLRHGAAVAGTPGAELDPRVHVSGNVRFPKAASDAFTNPALDAWLREHDVRELVVTGLFAPHYVRATVRGALERGYRVTLVSDALAAAIARVITTDSVPQPPSENLPFVHRVVTLAPLLAEAIRRAHTHAPPENGGDPR